MKVPALSFGTATFGGRVDGFGYTDENDARRIVDICIDAGANMFDSADVYSGGAAETILGKVIKGRRDQVIVSTKATFNSGPGPNELRIFALPFDQSR